MRSRHLPSYRSFEHERCVDAAEAEGVRDATRALAARGLPATWSSAHSGSGCSRLIVGGSDTRLERAHAEQRLERAGRAEQVAGHALAWTRPASRRRARRTRARSALRLASVAGRRAGGVRVHVVDVASARARRRRARARMQRARAGALGVGRGDVQRVGGGAVADQAARGCARRARARAPRARARAPPRPRPSRSRRGRRSKGRLARSGSSLRRESACMFAKPATTSGVIAASVPPASITSASPRSMHRAATRRARARRRRRRVTWQRFGPRSPWRIAT